VIPREIHVVNVEEKNGCPPLFMEKIKVGVGARAGKARRAKGVIDGKVPLSGRLTETIEGTIEDAHLAFLTLYHIALGLLNIDCMMKLIVEEGNFKVEVTYVPQALSSKGHHDAKGVILGNWGKSGIKVFARSLTKVLYNKSRFVSGRGAIGVQLGLIKPFGGDCGASREKVGKTPRSMFVVGLHFSIHSSLPARVLDSSSKSRRIRAQSGQG
jgi:hypothetical protein